jgi:hypothetical protein
LYFTFEKAACFFNAGTPLLTKQSKTLYLAIVEKRESIARKKVQSFSLRKEV